MAGRFDSSLIAVFCLLGFIYIARYFQASAKHPHSASISIASRQADLNPQGFEGNPDIYGLGVRLGFYFQWFGAVLSKWFRGKPEALRDLLDENGIFLLAIFIASILLCAGGTGSVHAVEILIMLHIFFGSSFIIIFDAAISDKYEIISSFWGIVIKYAITVGMASLGVWFWFVGIYKLPATPIIGNYAFFFKKFPITGGILTFFQVLAISNLVIWWHAFIGSILERWAYLQLFREKKASEESTEEKQGFFQILVELSVPSSDKFKTVPPDVNFFRQYVRLLFQPDLEKLSGEIRPYLTDTGMIAGIDITSPANGTIRVVPSNITASVFEYMIYIVCSLTARTQRYLEENQDTKPLTDEQRVAIVKYRTLLSEHPGLLSAPVQNISALLRILLFIAGIGPSLRKRLTPDISVNMGAFENAFPRMVNLALAMVEPRTSRALMAYSRAIPSLKLPFGGGQMRFELSGPFLLPTFIFEPPDPEVDVEQRHTIAPVRRVTGNFHRAFRLQKSKLKSFLRKIFKSWYTYSAKIFQLFVLIISITAIELIIRWNNITGTYNIKSTGQVIPLIIGSAGLWKVVFQIILSRSEGKEEDPKPATLTDFLIDQTAQIQGIVVPRDTGNQEPPESAAKETTLPNPDVNLAAGEDAIEPI